MGFRDANQSCARWRKFRSKKSSGMKTQSSAIVRGSDHFTRIIVSSLLAAALSAASYSCAVVSPSGACGVVGPIVFVVVRRWSRVWLGRGRLGSVEQGSGAARFTPDDRRDIDAGGVGMSVADLSISKRINAQRMAHLCRRLRAAPWCWWPLRLRTAQIRMAAASAPVLCTNTFTIGNSHASAELECTSRHAFASVLHAASLAALRFNLTVPKVQAPPNSSNSHLRT